MIDFGKTLIKSWKETIKNPILFVPKLFAFLISIGVLILFLIQSKLLNYFIKAGFSFKNLNILRTGLTPNYLLWVYLAIYLIIELASSVFFSGMSLGMYRDITLRKKTSLVKGFNYGKKYFFEIIGISIVYYLVVGIPIFAIFYVFMTPVFENIFARWIFVSFYAVFMAYWIFLVILRLFFVYATMVFKNKKLGKTIQMGATFGKVHFKHTLITWLIVLGITLFYTLIQRPTVFSVVLTRQIYIIALVILIFTVLEIIISIWEHIFIFNIYLKERG